MWHLRRMSMSHVVAEQEEDRNVGCSEVISRGIWKCYLRADEYQHKRLLCQAVVNVTEKRQSH